MGYSEAESLAIETKDEQIFSDTFDVMTTLSAKCLCAS